MNHSLNLSISEQTRCVKTVRESCVMRFPYVRLKLDIMRIIFNLNMASNTPLELAHTDECELLLRNTMRTYHQCALLIAHLSCAPNCVLIRTNRSYRNSYVHLVTISKWLPLLVTCWLPALAIWWIPQWIPVGGYWLSGGNLCGNLRLETIMKV